MRLCSAPTARSQRARAGFRVQTGEMKPRADGIEGRLTLEGNDG